ncbi:MAG: hypothetical protein Q4G03_09075 [Planctomycetia bacterium]|nr:hypothetical protein [Planctomycetia bacterium]
MRRGRPKTDSLELFLDTICNMFGGFIFIMLFVVVSMRNTSEARIEQTLQNELEQTRMTAAQYRSLEQELESLQDQWRLVEQSERHAQQFLEETTDQRVVETYRETDKLREQVQALEQETSELLQNATQIQQDMLEIEAQIKELQLSVEQAQRQNQEMRKQLQDANDRKTRKVYAPQRHRNYKPEVAVVLKYGRLYFRDRYNPDGRRQGFNKDDMFVVRDSLLYTQIEPKPLGGIDLNASDAKARLQEAFRIFQPDAVVVTVIVAVDSYEEYGVALDFLKSRDFDVRLLFGPPGTMFCDSGARDSWAQ